MATEAGIPAPICETRTEESAKTEEKATIFQPNKLPREEANQPDQLPEETFVDDQILGTASITKICPVANHVSSCDLAENPDHPVTSGTETSFQISDQIDSRPLENTTTSIEDTSSEKLSNDEKKSGKSILDATCTGNELQGAESSFLQENDPLLQKDATSLAKPEDSENVMENTVNDSQVEVQGQSKTSEEVAETHTKETENLLIQVEDSQMKQDKCLDKENDDLSRSEVITVPDKIVLKEVTLLKEQTEKPEELLHAAIEDIKPSGLGQDAETNALKDGGFTAEPHEIPSERTDETVNEVVKTEEKLVVQNAPTPVSEEDIQDNSMLKVEEPGEKNEECLEKESKESLANKTLMKGENDEEAAIHEPRVEKEDQLKPGFSETLNTLLEVEPQVGKPIQTLQDSSEEIRTAVSSQNMTETISLEKNLTTYPLDIPDDQTEEENHENISNTGENSGIQVAGLGMDVEDHFKESENPSFSGTCNNDAVENEELIRSELLEKEEHGESTLMKEEAQKETAVKSLHAACEDVNASTLSQDDGTKISIDVSQLENFPLEENHVKGIIENVEATNSVTTAELPEENLCTSLQNVEAKESGENAKEGTISFCEPIDGMNSNEVTADEVNPESSEPNDDVTEHNIVNEEVPYGKSLVLPGTKVSEIGVAGNPLPTPLIDSSTKEINLKEVRLDDGIYAEDLDIPAEKVSHKEEKSAETLTAVMYDKDDPRGLMENNTTERQEEVRSQYKTLEENSESHRTPLAAGKSGENSPIQVEENLGKQNDEPTFTEAAQDYINDDASTVTKYVKYEEEVALQKEEMVKQEELLHASFNDDKGEDIEVNCSSKEGSDTAEAQEQLSDVTEDGAVDVVASKKETFENISIAGEKSKTEVDDSLLKHEECFEKESTESSTSKASMKDDSRHELKVENEEDMMLKVETRTEKHAELLKDDSEDNKIDVSSQNMEKTHYLEQDARANPQANPDDQIEKQTGDVEKGETLELQNIAKTEGNLVIQANAAEMELEEHFDNTEKPSLTETCNRDSILLEDENTQESTILTEEVQEKTPVESLYVTDGKIEAFPPSPDTDDKAMESRQAEQSAATIVPSEDDTEEKQDTEKLSLENTNLVDNLHEAETRDRGLQNEELICSARNAESTSLTKEVEMAVPTEHLQQATNQETNATCSLVREIHQANQPELLKERNTEAIEIREENVKDAPTTASSEQTGGNLLISDTESIVSHEPRIEEFLEKENNNVSLNEATRGYIKDDVSEVTDNVKSEEEIALLKEEMVKSDELLYAVVDNKASASSENTETKPTSTEETLEKLSNKKGERAADVFITEEIYEDVEKEIADEVEPIESLHVLEDGVAKENNDQQLTQDRKVEKKVEAEKPIEYFHALDGDKPLSQPIEVTKEEEKKDAFHGEDNALCQDIEVANDEIKEEDRHVALEDKALSQDSEAIKEETDEAIITESMHVPHVEAKASHQVVDVETEDAEELKPLESSHAAYENDNSTGQDTKLSKEENFVMSLPVACEKENSLRQESEIAKAETEDMFVKSLHVASEDDKSPSHKTEATEKESNVIETLSVAPEDEAPSQAMPIKDEGIEEKPILTTLVAPEHDTALCQDMEVKKEEIEVEKPLESLHAALKDGEAICQDKEVVSQKTEEDYPECVNIAPLVEKPLSQHMEAETKEVDEQNHSDFFYVSLEKGNESNKDSTQANEDAAEQLIESLQRASNDNDYTPAKEDEDNMVTSHQAPEHQSKELKEDVNDVVCQSKVQEEPETDKKDSGSHMPVVDDQYSATPHSIDTEVTAHKPISSVQETTGMNGNTSVNVGTVHDGEKITDSYEKEDIIHHQSEERDFTSKQNTQEGRGDVTKTAQNSGTEVKETMLCEDEKKITELDTETKEKDAQYTTNPETEGPDATEEVAVGISEDSDCTKKELSTTELSEKAQVSHEKSLDVTSLVSEASEEEKSDHNNVGETVCKEGTEDKKLEELEDESTTTSNKETVELCGASTEATEITQDVPKLEVCQAAVNEITFETKETTTKEIGTDFLLREAAALQDHSTAERKLYIGKVESHQTGEAETDRKDEVEVSEHKKLVECSSGTQIKVEAEGKDLPELSDEKNEFQEIYSSEVIKDEDENAIKVTASDISQSKEILVPARPEEVLDSVSQEQNCNVISEAEEVELAVKKVETAPAERKLDAVPEETTKDATYEATEKIHEEDQDTENINIGSCVEETMRGNCQENEVSQGEGEFEFIINRYDDKEVEQTVKNSNIEFLVDKDNKATADFVDSLVVNEAGQELKENINEDTVLDAKPPEITRKTIDDCEFNGGYSDTTTMIQRGDDKIKHEISEGSLGEKSEKRDGNNENCSLDIEDLNDENTVMLEVEKRVDEKADYPSLTEDDSERTCNEAANSEVLVHKKVEPEVKYTENDNTDSSISDKNILVLESKVSKETPSLVETETLKPSKQEQEVKEMAPCEEEKNITELDMEEKGKDVQHITNPETEGPDTTEEVALSISEDYDCNEKELSSTKLSEKAKVSHKNSLGVTSLVSEALEEENDHNDVGETGCKESSEVKKLEELREESTTISTKENVELCGASTDTRDTVKNSNIEFPEDRANKGMVDSVDSLIVNAAGQELKELPNEDAVLDVEPSEMKQKTIEDCEINEGYTHTTTIQQDEDEIKHEIPAEGSLEKESEKWDKNDENCTSDKMESKDENTVILEQKEGGVDTLTKLTEDDTERTCNVAAHPVSPVHEPEVEYTENVNIDSLICDKNICVSESKDSKESPFLAENETLKPSKQEEKSSCKTEEHINNDTTKEIEKHGPVKKLDELEEESTMISTKENVEMCGASIEASEVTHEMPKLEVCQAAVNEISLETKEITTKEIEADFLPEEAELAEDQTTTERELHIGKTESLANEEAETEKEDEVSEHTKLQDCSSGTSVMVEAEGNDLPELCDEKNGSREIYSSEIIKDEDDDPIKVTASDINQSEEILVPARREEVLDSVSQEKNSNVISEAEEAELAKEKVEAAPAEIKTSVVSEEAPKVATYEATETAAEVSREKIYEEDQDRVNKHTSTCEEETMRGSCKGNEANQGEDEFEFINQYEDKEVKNSNTEFLEDRDNKATDGYIDSLVVNAAGQELKEKTNEDTVLDVKPSDMTQKTIGDCEINGGYTGTTTDDDKIKHEIPEGSLGKESEKLDKNDEKCTSDKVDFNDENTMLLEAEKNKEKADTLASLTEDESKRTCIEAANSETAADKQLGTEVKYTKNINNNSAICHKNIIVSESKDSKESLSLTDTETVKSSKQEQEKSSCENEEQISNDTTEEIKASEPVEVQTPSLSDLIHEVPTKEPSTYGEEVKPEKTHEAEHEKSKTDEEKDDEEECGEHHKSDSSSEAPVMVEAGDADVKIPHKKSHNLLSGVGSKVKHSIAKVKKAITGKSSHSKPTSPK